MSEMVELEEAYCWNCPNCGELNFGKLEVNTCSLEQKEKTIRTELELEDWQELPEGWENEIIASSPDSVNCQKCNASFEVDYSEEEEE